MRPLVCDYYITLRCNDTCEFCEIWRRGEDCEEAKTEDVIKNLSDLKDIGVVYIDFTGGEPLLREDLKEILTVAKGAKFYTSLTTNCILYPERADSLKGLVNRLLFSLDSPDPSEHDRIRGAYSFERVLESIKAARALGENPMINFTATRDSIRFLPELIDFAREYKILIYINPVYDYEGLQGFERTTIEFIKYFFRNKYITMNLGALEFIEVFGNKITKERCRAGDAVVTISPDNFLISPCFFNGQKKIKIDSNLKEIWKSKEIKAARNTQGRGETCDGCMRWPYMIPSFYYKIDKYFFLNLYSLWDLLWKEYRLRKDVEK